MRVWQRNKVNGITLYEYGDVAISPCHVRGKRRWFIMEKRQVLGDRNGYERLKDAKVVANEELDERNRAPSFGRNCGRICQNCAHWSPPFIVAHAGTCALAPKVGAYASDDCFGWEAKTKAS